MYPSQQSNHKSKRSILRIIGTISALGLVIYLIWRNWTGFLDALGSLPVPLLLLLLTIALMSRFLVTLRWFILLRLTYPELCFFTVLKLSFVGLFSTNVLPSTIGGDVVKLGGAVQFGLESSDVTASLIVDRLVGLATMASFLPIGIFSLFQNQTLSKIMMGSIAGEFFAKIWQRTLDFLIRVKKALTLWLKQPKHLMIAAICSYGHMACTFAMVSLILSSLGETVPFLRVGGLWVLVYFITLIPISINGLGLQEFSLSLVFTNYAGVSDANSLVLALLMRVLFMTASLPGALFFPEVLTGDTTIGQQQDDQG